MKPLTMLRRAASGAALASVGVMAAGVLPAAASATLGQTGTDGQLCGGGEFSGVQESTASGVPSYRVPGGISQITSWSTQAGVDGGSMALEIWRPVHTANTYSLVAISPTETLTAATVNTFVLSSPIAVHPGDLLGFDATAADCTVTRSGPATDVAGATLGSETSPPTTGTDVVFGEQNTGVQINISVQGSGHH